MAEAEPAATVAANLPLAGAPAPAFLLALQPGVIITGAWMNRH